MPAHDADFIAKERGIALSADYRSDPAGRGAAMAERGARHLPALDAL